MNIAERIVNFHATNASAKLNASNKTAAVMRAAVLSASLKRRGREAESASYVAGRHTLLAQGSQGRRPLPLGQLLLLLVENEAMMLVAGRRQPKQSLQDDLNMSGRRKIGATGNERDALKGIIDDHRQMISSGQSFPGEHDISEQGRSDWCWPQWRRTVLAFFLIAGVAAQFRGADRIQPGGMRIATCQSRGTFLFG